MLHRRNDWLDCCRALAIALVLLSHGRMFVLPVAPVLDVLKIGGFLGVELFFVLSGLLIGSLLLRALSAAPVGIHWIGHFWGRRWARTLPAYWAFLALNLVLLATGLRQAPAPELLRYLSFTQNIASPHPPFMAEAWSLAVEEIFYLLSPLLMAMLVWRLPARRAYLLTAFLLLVASGGARCFVAMNGDVAFDEGLRKVALLRLDAIAIGLLLAAWQARLPRLLLVVGLACWIGAAMLASLPAARLDHDMLIKLAIFPLAGIGSAALLRAVPGTQLPASVMWPVRWLAALSYSAYLANLPVQAALRAAFGVAQTPAGAGLRWLAFIGGTLLLAAVSRRWIERPVLDWRDRRFPEPTASPMAAPGIWMPAASVAGQQGGQRNE